MFASPEPLTPKMLYRSCSPTSRRKTSRRRVEGARAADYDRTRRPAPRRGRRRLPDHDAARSSTNGCAGCSTSAPTQKLTVQALETLAVIAYKQPITAAEIGEIRGVNTSGVLSTLLERHLIKIVGRKNVVGRPFLYGTTREFLIRFGLKDLATCRDRGHGGGARLRSAGRPDRACRRGGRCCRSRNATRGGCRLRRRLSDRSSQNLPAAGAGRATSGFEMAQGRSGPMRIRASSRTGWPIASHIRRTWRLRPS